MHLPEPSQNSYELEIFADYYQIYLQDEAAEGDLSAGWSKEAINNLFASAPGIVGIGTVRNTDVPVTVHVIKSEPQHDNFADWDHIVETSINVPSGKIIVAGPTDYLPSAFRIPIEPDIYRVRIYYANLESISQDGLEGEDHYQIVLWPEEYKSSNILKQRQIP